MTYEIHSGIPAPIIARPGRTAGTTYPFADLEKDQCFLVPLAEDSEKTVLNRVRTKCQRWKKLTSTDFKFRIAKFTDPVTDEAVIGVWRTA
jgi:hypothetical protein